MGKNLIGGVFDNCHYGVYLYIFLTSLKTEMYDIIVLHLLDIWVIL